MTEKISISNPRMSSIRGILLLLSLTGLLSANPTIFNYFTNITTNFAVYNLTTNITSNYTTNVIQRNASADYTNVWDSYFRNQTTFISNNYGVSETLEVFQAGTRKALIKFELPILNKDNIISAICTLSNGNLTAAGDLNFHTVLFPWDEGNGTGQNVTNNGTNGATARFRIHSNNVTNLWSLNGLQAGTDYVSTPFISDSNVSAVGTYSFNFFSVVTNWLNLPSSNHGVVIKNGSVNPSIKFRSSESATPADRPKLTLVHVSSINTNLTTNYTSITTNVTSSNVVYTHNLSREVFSSPANMLSYDLTLLSNGNAFSLNSGESITVYRSQTGFVSSTNDTNYIVQTATSYTKWSTSILPENSYYYSIYVNLSGIQYWINDYYSAPFTGENEILNIQLNRDNLSSSLNSQLLSHPLVTSGATVNTTYDLQAKKTTYNFINPEKLLITGLSENTNIWADDKSGFPATKLFDGEKVTEDDRYQSASDGTGYITLNLGETKYINKLVFHAPPDQNTAYLNISFPQFIKIYSGTTAISETNTNIINSSLQFVDYVNYAKEEYVKEMNISAPIGGNILKVQFDSTFGGSAIRLVELDLYSSTRVEQSETVYQNPANMSGQRVLFPYDDTGLSVSDEQSLAVFAYRQGDWQKLTGKQQVNTTYNHIVAELDYLTGDYAVISASELNGEIQVPSTSVFNAVTSAYEFNLSTSKSKKIQIEINDLKGSFIVDLAEGESLEGFKTYSWRGQNHQGQDSSTGIYIYAVKFDGVVQKQGIICLVR